MGFADGKVLEAEIDGEEFHHKIHQATPDNILYFCNERFLEKDRFSSSEPYGFQHFNEMRKCSAKLKIDQFSKKDTSWDAEKLLRFQGTSLENRKKANNKWSADTLTPSSLQNICMIPQNQEALVIPGEAPKFFNNQALSLNNVFQRLDSKIIKIKGKANSPSFQKGLRHFMQAQVSHDKGDTHAIYHNIQLAIDYFEGDAYQNIAKFYFLVFQYIHESHKKSLSATLSGFKELDGSLPHYLNDHCTLFIARLEKIIKGQTTVGIDEIKNLNLQRIYDFEKKMPKLLFHKATKELMAPRLELLDIFYPHVKA